MQGKEIILWLDERWYNALNKHLKDETLEEHLEDVIDQLCNQLPEHEYARISHEIWQEDQENHQAAEAARRFAVFRVREKGADSVFCFEENCDALLAAKKLRSYVQDSPNNPGCKFADTFRNAVPIRNRDFNEAVIERLENTSGRVTGAFDIDMDDGTFSTLHSTSGWQTFTRRAAISAAYFAMKKDSEAWGRRMQIFVDRLQGKQINPDHEFTLLRGERSLEDSDICFAEEIIQNDNCLEFYMEVNFNADELFGTNISADQPRYYLNVYANYDMEAEQVYDALTVILVSEKGDVELHYPLSQEEKDRMLPKMEAFVQNRYGQSLGECREQYLAESSQEARPAPEMQM